MNLGLSRRFGASVVVLTLLLAGCCYYVFKAATVRLIAQSDVRVVPFVLQREVYYYRDNPGGELRMRETVARRSDGARVEISSDPPAVKALAGRTIKFLDGSSVDLIDLLKSKTTWPASEAQASVLRARTLNPPRNCVFAGETLASEGATLLGQKVAVVKLGPPHGPRITAWRAPNLGCTDLQYRSEDARPDGSYKLVTEDRAVSLRLVEPDPALFDEGRDYAELRPSELGSRVDAWFGVTSVGEDVQKPRDQADRLYDQSWAGH